GSAEGNDAGRRWLLDCPAASPFFTARRRFVVTVPTALETDCPAGRRGATGGSCRIALDTDRPIRRIPRQSSGCDYERVRNSRVLTCSTECSVGGSAAATRRDPSPTRFVKEDPAHATPAPRLRRSAEGH